MITYHGVSDMGTIETMLQLEHLKLQRAVERLEVECAQRPRGSLVNKKRGKSSYIYLVKRETGKVLTEYVGPDGCWKAKGLEAKIIERRRYERELKETRDQLAVVRKMMKASGVFFG
jgi:hypothetical protein